MELFLPGIVLILLSAFFAFMVLPRIGTLVLAVVAFVAIILVGLHHYSMFYAEWRLSTWQYSVSSYAPFIVLGFAFLIIMASVGYIFAGEEIKNAIKTPMDKVQEGVSNSVSNMPNASTATNPVTSSINKAINANVKANGLGYPDPSLAKVNKNVKSPPIPGAGFSASAI
jgi:hypothetical protein